MSSQDNRQRTPASPSHSGLSDYARLLRSLSADSIASLPDIPWDSFADDQDVAILRQRQRDSGFSSNTSTRSSDDLQFKRPSFSTVVEEDYDSGLSDDDRPQAPSRRPSNLAMTVDDLLKELDSALDGRPRAPQRKHSENLLPKSNLPQPTTRRRAPSAPAPISTEQASRAKARRTIIVSPPSAPLPPPPTMMSPPPTPTSAPHFFSHAPLTSTASGEGYIQKQSSSLFSSWKRRYLVLDRGTLYLFKTKSSSHKDLESMLRITSDTCIRVSENGLWVLEVVGYAGVYRSESAEGGDAAKKMWVIRCDGKEDMVRWLDLVRLAIKEVSRLNLSPPPSPTVPPVAPPVKSAAAPAPKQKKGELVIQPGVGAWVV